MGLLLALIFILLSETQMQFSSSVACRYLDQLLTLVGTIFEGMPLTLVLSL